MKTYEHLVLDDLMIPTYPSIINEADTRDYGRLVGITKHLKFDKFNRVTDLLIKKPLPKIGDTKCYLIPCPSYVQEVVCWKCKVYN
jgi:hypothetical protein